MPMPRLCPFRPDFGKDLENFPPLPKINCDSIRQKVFTHRSYYARPTHIFEDHPNDLSPDNEKLEHLGDTVLSLVVTGLMFEAYPGLHVGPSTKIRALVVGNATLADISLRYRLPYRLRLHAAQAITLRASTNIQADVFESYVGGLYMDQGLDAVKAWLNPLLLPYTQEAYKLVRAQYGLPQLRTSPINLPTSSPSYDSSSGSTSPGAEPGRLSPATPPSGSEMEEQPISPSALAIGHLALFNQQLQKANLDIEWIYSDDEGVGLDEFLGGDTSENENGVAVSLNASSANGGGGGGGGGGSNVSSVMKKATKTTPMWTVKAMVNGEFYGSGKGTSKKAARHVAAKEGLQRLGIHV